MSETNIFQKLEDINNTKTFNIIYTLSHLILAIILIYTLRKYNSVLLFSLLSCLLGYIIYTSDMPFYVLPVIGLICWGIDLITNTEENIEIDPTKKMKDTSWKIPFYSIIGYYTVIFTNYFKKSI